MSPLSDTLRLLALGLISFADDGGRVLDSPKQIEAFVWPRHSRFAAVVKGLASLEELGFIERGKTAAGQAVIQIVNWEKHQKVDHPNLKAALPEILANGSRRSRDALARDSRLDLRSTIYDHLPATEGARESLAKERRPASKTKKPKRSKPATFAEIATRDPS